MVDLKKAMGEHQGSYLLNLSFYDIEMNDIFSRPNKAIGYANPLVDMERRDRYASTSGNSNFSQIL
ncbi:MAG: hypothetical protein QXU18_13505 [Thermoplasmatales archaeon]